MKKFLLCIALLGMIAVPAWADIAPGGGSQMTLVPLINDAGAPGPQSRNLTYDGANEVYDNLASQVGGAGPGAAWVSGYAASSWLFDDVHATTALNSTFNHQHVVFQGTDTGPGTTRTQVIGYFDNPGGFDTANGGALTTTGLGSPAVFLYNLPVFSPGFAQSWTLTHPGVIMPAGGNLYAGYLSFDIASVWGSSAPNNVGTPGVSHQGSGFTTTISTPTPGGGSTPTLTFIVTVNGMMRPGAPFATAGGGPVVGGPFGMHTTGNLVIALGFVPEPATIGILALGGLLALRRRRS